MLIVPCGGLSNASRQTSNGAERGSPPGALRGPGVGARCHAGGATGFDLEVSRPRSSALRFPGQFPGPGVPEVLEGLLRLLA